MNRAALDWIPDLLAFLSRRWRVIVTGLGVGLGIGVAYLLFASTKYTAETTLLIDTQATAPFQQQAVAVDAQYANGIVESQVEVLQSDGLARAIVRRLGLAHDAAFLRNGRSLSGAILGPVFGLFSAAPRQGGGASAAAETKAAEILLRLIKVRRIGLSFVIDVDVTSLDPEMSARLANALADEFIELGLDARNGNTRRASGWLQTRIAGLRDQAIAADQAAQAFKARAHIVDTDKGLMNERHLGELNSQLVLARAKTADARAKFDRAEAVIKSGDLSGNLSDALQNEVIVHLREDYVDAANHVAEWRARYGERHAAVQQQEQRMRDLQMQMMNELRRIAAGYQSDYQEALASEQDIERQLQALSGDASVTNADLVTLRALQSSAETYRTLYENFLQRYTQAVQDQSFPISEARVVTPAMPPLRQSWPKAQIVLAGGAVLGLFLGFALAFVRDSMDRSFRNAAQVRSALGLACLAVLPELTPRGRRLRRRRAEPAARLLRYAAEKPLSGYGEAIRGLRIRIAQSLPKREGASVVACISLLPGEGKTTVSANYAFFLAQAGFRTLLIDWDLRQPTISQTLAPGQAAGFFGVAAGTHRLETAIRHDPETGLDILPLGSGAVASEALDSAATAQLMAALRRDYAYIVIDLPASEVVADAHLAAQLLDGLILVVQWGRTQQERVLEWLTAGGIDQRKVIGAILNRADMDLIRNYPADAQAPEARARQEAA